MHRLCVLCVRGVWAETAGCYPLGPPFDGEVANQGGVTKGLEMGFAGCCLAAVGIGGGSDGGRVVSWSLEEKHNEKGELGNVGMNSGKYPVRVIECGHL